MRPKEFVVWINPAELAPWNGAEVPVRFVWMENGITVHYPRSPHLSPELLQQLRTDYVEIASSLTPQSQRIFWFLLNTAEGWANGRDLIEYIWSSEPNLPTVRQAVFQLRESLMSLNFGYVVWGSSSGIYSIVPVAEHGSDSRQRKN